MFPGAFSGISILLSFLSCNYTLIITYHVSEMHLGSCDPCKHNSSFFFFNLRSVIIKNIIMGAAYAAVRQLIILPEDLKMSCDAFSAKIQPTF